MAMTEAQRRAEIRDEVRKMVVHALAEDGTTLPAVQKLGEWFRDLNEHRKDEAKHAAGGISEAKSRAIAKEEDAKLKVTK